MDFNGPRIEQPRQRAKSEYIPPRKPLPSQHRPGPLIDLRPEQNSNPSGQPSGPVNRSSHHAPEVRAAETEEQTLPQFHDDSALEADLLNRYVRTADTVGNDPNQRIYVTKETNVRVVIRKTENGPSQETLDVRREIAVLSAVSDPSVLPLVEWLELEDSIWTVREYRPLRTIRQMVELQGGPFSEDYVKNILNQLFLGIASIFLAGYAHLRICDETVCLDENEQVVITDLHYACEYGKEKVGNLYAPTQEKRFSDLYVAPEVFANNTYNARKATLWSCGILLYFMVTGETDKLSNIDHPSFEKPGVDQQSSTEPDQAPGHRRTLSNAQAKIIMYPNNRFSVPNYARSIIPKMLVQDPTRRAELIEVATRVPKDFALNALRPLVEIAWLDYKAHVGPYAELHIPDRSSGSILDSSAASSIFSYASRISNPFASLMGKKDSRRKSAPPTAYSRGASYR